MCNLKSDFILCSCSGTTLKKEEVDWYLQRKNSALPIQYRKGKVAQIQISKKESIQLDEIILELNSRNCFDFEFVPAEDDRIRLKINDKWYAFRFRNNAWQFDKSTALDGWRSQLEQKDAGIIQ